jgi:3-oxoacyl-[acyl-carrier protein] reductase
MIIVITGTSRGIGKELAEYYLEEGNLVYGCSRGDSTIYHELYTHFSIDISDEKSVSSMIKFIYSIDKKIDVLINNAGIASMNHFCSTPYNTVKNIFETNFGGSFLFSRESAKIMMRHNFGRIINFSTIAVRLNLEGEMVYAASKSAIEKMTQIIAKELGNFNITVNTIAISPFETNLIKNIHQDKIQKIINEQSKKRFTRIDDIINTINFLIDKKSEFVTGQIINLG